MKTINKDYIKERWDEAFQNFCSEIERKGFDVFKDCSLSCDVREELELIASSTLTGALLSGKAEPNQDTPALRKLMLEMIKDDVVDQVAAETRQHLDKLTEES